MIYVYYKYKLKTLNLISSLKKGTQTVLFIIKFQYFLKKN